MKGKFFPLSQTLFKRPRHILYIAAAGAFLIVLTSAVWIAGERLAYHFSGQYMRSVSLDALERLDETHIQIVDTLNKLNTISSQKEQCYASTYESLVALMRKWRYINESAVRLKSGVVCSSFGVELAPYKLPSTSEASHYQSNDGKQYWFYAGSHVSADDGVIVIAQNNGYLWLNKGIILDALHIPPSIKLDLFDSLTFESRLSSIAVEAGLASLPPSNKISSTADHLTYSFPVKWFGLSAVLALPENKYHLWHFTIFIFLWLLSIGTAYSLFRMYFRAQINKSSLLFKLEKAIANDQLKIHYQPITDMTTGEWKGAEALLRWDCDGQAIPPSVFIPLAENNGLITHVTRRLCERVAVEHSTYLWPCKNFYVTINLSAQDLADTTFADFVVNLFKTHSINASKIVFEVTEGSLVVKELACAQLHKLRSYGYRIALDDFGTGYSSLSYLEDLPVDILKIDRSFLSDSKLSSPDSVIWHIVNLAQSLNLVIVAEGVENIQQAKALKLANVTLAQGWLYANSMPIDKLAEQLFNLESHLVAHKAQ